MTDPTVQRKQLLKQALDRIEELEARLDEAERLRRAPIAVVGIGCRFPGGADDPERLWQQLVDGRCAIGGIPRSRWDADAFFDADPSAPGKSYARHGAFLDDVAGFDPLVFGISPRDAAAMDPQHRLLLEVAWEALERAGQPPTGLSGSKSGVYVGITLNDYARLLADGGFENVDAYHVTGSLLNFASGRLSYVLGLQGPSLAVDTACSSSLVAVHLACQALRLGECDLALGAGVNLMLTPHLHVMMSKARLLSPSGQCRTFDAAADGMVRSEGCGVVVLKRLDDALAAGDSIWAVIRGSAVNQDGPSSGITVPNRAAQEAVIRRALTVAGVAPLQVGYVEAHGTGTPLGDPIEIGALAAALCVDRPADRPLRVGSIKTNIGHAESAAGIAGLIKAVLTLRQGAIAPHLGLTTPNPHVDWSALPIEVPRALTPWREAERFAGVSAFGASGTNAHVVLAAAPEPAVTDAVGAPALLLPLSAKTPAALSARAAALRDWLAQSSAAPLADVAHSAARSGQLEHRLTVVAHDRAQLLAALDAHRDGAPHAVVAQGRAVAGVAPRVVFVFPGQGSQWLGMGRQLYAEEPVFAAAFDEVAAAIARAHGWSLVDELRADGERAQLDRIDVIQPLLFAIGVALAALWRSWGIEPDAVVGHSMGEVAAAHVAGALCLDDAVTVICRRSQLMRRLSGGGAMALTELARVEAEAEIAGEPRLAVAVSNSPRATVIAGDPEALDALLARLALRGVFCRRIKVDVASHSPQVDPILDELRAALAGLTPRPLRVPMLSTVSGMPVRGPELDADYWVRNLRQPVRFGDAVAQLVAEGHHCFVELSPHPILLPSIGEALAATPDGLALPSLRRDEPERAVLLGSLGALFTRGSRVEWARLVPAGRRLVALPAYPWQRERHWAETGAPRARTTTAAQHALLGEPLSLSAHPQAHYWQASLRADERPDLAQHRVHGQPVLPGTAYVELALAAADTLLDGARAAVEDFTFERMLRLPDGAERALQTAASREGDGLRLELAVAEADGWQRCAAGRVRPLAAGEAAAAVDLAALRGRCARAVDAGELYERLRARGLDYGPRYRGLTALWLGSDEALGRLSAAADVAAERGRRPAHAALLDAAFHALAALVPDDGAALAPAALERLRAFAAPAEATWVHARLRPGTVGGGRVGDLVLVDDDGVVCADVRGLRLVPLAAAATSAAGDARVHAVAWRRRELAAGGDAHGRYLLFVDEAGAGEALAAELERRGGRCLRVRAGAHNAIVDDDRRTLDVGDAAALRALVREQSAAGGLRAAVYLWGLDTPAADLDCGAGLRALQLAQALVLDGGRATPRLLLVTRGVHALDGDTAPIALGQAPLWGLGRTLALEHPELGCTLIDLDPASAAHDAAALADELGAGDGESQLAWRGGRYGARLVRRSVPAAAALPIVADGSYLISGGLGGLGLTLARGLVAAGARALLLVGRSAPSPAAAAAVAELHAAGARVRVVAADVADRAQVDALVAAAADLPPLRGVFHAAGLLDDGTALTLTAAQWAAALAPKLRGGWNLHAATLDVPLDLFVLYGAAAAVLGSPGQANYGAANAFLDALAHERRRLGRPALAVDWGPFAEVGLAAARADRGARLATRGLGSLSPADSVAALGPLWAAGTAQAAFVDLDVRRWLEFVPSAAALPFYGELPRERGRSSAVRSLKPALAAAAPAQRRALLERHLTDELGRVLRLPAARLDRLVPFGQLGVDSLMSLELRNRLEASLELKLSATLLFTYANLAALVDHLATTLALDDDAAAAPVAVAAPARAVAADDAIAIVGMSCRFPGGATSLDAYWRLLRDGGDAVGEAPRDRWPAAPADAADPVARAARWGAFLREIDRFDPHFFGISPREAVHLDPQQRLLLELAWEALEGAGIVPERLAGSAGGVFIGMSTNDYARLGGGRTVYDMTGNGHCFPPGRLAYTLGLQGPSLTVDTACSSSLVAVHLACQSLRAGESTLALVGGVNLILSPAMTHMLAQAGALSVDGHCKSFDVQANGFVRGEGGAMVVLKRLADAVADGDPVLAIVRGSAVNQDGRSTGLTAPNVLSQQAMLRQALAHAAVAPDEIGYVETHGTGTSLGDPIELEALKAVLGRPRADGSTCVLGAVKSNLGHLEAAAGLAGLIKVVLSLRHQVIPGNLHFSQLNPRVSLDETPFVIPTAATAWPSGGKRRRAGVSSFGLSGTNAHVVLEEWPAPVAAAVADDAPRLVPLSAKSAPALRELAQAFAALPPDGAVADLAYTAACRRTHHGHRLALVGSSRAELAAAAAAFARGEDGAASGVVAERAKVVFVFPGQGSQWVGMGRALYRDEPAFAAALGECDQAIRRHAGFSVVAELEAAAPRLDDIDVVQPLLFAIEVALAAWWRAHGVEPDAVIGHSMGELAAACVAGALSIDDAARVICRRSRLMKRLSGQGAMALVELSTDEAQAALREVADRLSVAVSNGPRSTVIAGDPAALETVLAALQARAVFCRRVKVEVASHSPQMDQLRDELLAALAEVRPRPARLAMRSTVTNEPIAGPELDADYWVRNLRQPVRFAEATQQLIADGHTLFVELSPHPILLPAIEENLRARGQAGAAIASLRRESDERRCLTEALGALYVHGYEVDWRRLYPTARPLAALPPYPFQRERFWVDEAAAAPIAVAPAEASSWLGAPLPLALADMRVWEARLRADDPPFVADHRVGGEVVFCGTGFVELALAAARERFGAGALTVESLTLGGMLTLTAAPRRLQTTLRDDGPGRAHVSVASLGDDGHWREHAAATLSPGSDATATSSEPPSQLQARLQPATPSRPSDERGIVYGPAFHGLRQLWRGDGEALGRVELPTTAGSSASHCVHPALLDACFQTAAALLDGVAPALQVPVAIERLRLSAPPGPAVWVHAIRRELSADGARFDLRLLDDDGAVCCAITGLRSVALDGGAAADPLDGCGHVVAWEPVAAAPPLPPSERPWLLFGDGAGMAAALAEELRGRGQRCVRVTLGRERRRLAADHYQLGDDGGDGLRALLHEAFGDDGCAHAVHLSSLEVTAAAATTGASLQADLARGSVSALQLAQAFLRVDWRDRPRLALVTRGAQSVDGREPVALAQAPLWGLGRTLALEHPELGCTQIDLGATDDAAALAAELCAGERATAVALRPGRRLVARLVTAPLEADDAARPLVAAADRPFRLRTLAPGQLDRLALHVCARRPPGPGEVELAVDVGALNFLDVLLALGTLPDPAPGDGGPALGGELAGRVVAVGAGVTGLTVGQEVIALGRHAFGSFVTTSRRLVWPRPRGLGAADAATLPVAFLTAYYALERIARLRPGERVLIHAAAGGVGMAALQWAKLVGAEVFASAGSDDKRAQVRALGADHVVDSRSLGFADEIMRLTGGQGVDVVLNSLAGDFIPAGLGVLREHGRFVEIGKRDYYANKQLGLRPFLRNLSFTLVDLDAMIRKRPQAIDELMQALLPRFADGSLRPLPWRAFAVSQAVEAFHHLAQARHVGKVLLTMADPDARVVPAATAAVRADGSYLVTGGLGGLGLGVARWLVDAGARHLVLAGRRAPDAAAEAVLAELRAAGAQVRVAQADVSRADDVAALVATTPPLAGVIHAAATLDDHTILELDGERFAGPFAPKMLGAWNLHLATRDRPLDFFVLYSSFASLVGSPGQANYAAANAFLDALAHERVAAGLPATSIQWGPFADVGLAAATALRGRRLAARGVASLTPEEGTRALARVLARPRAQIGIARFDARQWIEFYPGSAASPFLATLRSAAAAALPAAESSALRETLLAASADERTALLEEHLRQQLARVLRLEPARIERGLSFSRLGLDSLMSLELRNRLEASLGQRLSATLLYTYATVAALAAHLSGALAGPPPNPPPPVVPSAPIVVAAPPPADVAALSAQESEAALAAELAALEEYIR